MTTPRGGSLINSRRRRPLLPASKREAEAADDSFASENKNNNHTHDDDDKHDDEDEQQRFAKAVRVARVRAEIDRLLKGPDALFDAEEELKQVDSISPGLEPGSEEETTEQVLEQMEKELYAAVQEENFTAAKAKQQEIGQMHVDDCGAVLQVHSAFYKAFSHKDSDAMERLWLHDAGVVCIHPSHTPIVGINAVLKSWKKMFETTNGSFQRNWMEPSNIRMMVKGTTAIVTCDEDVFARRFVRGQKRQTERLNKLTATNIFRKVNGRWFMVHHHSSWHAESENAKMALNGASSASSTRNGGSGVGGNPRVVFRGRNSGGGAEENILSDGILGDFGPFLGGPSSNNQESAQEGTPVKRVILGNLKDILSGGLGDILKDGTQGGEEKTIIHFRQVNADEDGDDNDDDEEEDVIEVVEDDDDDSEAVSIIQEWATSQDDSSKAQSPSGKSSSQSGGRNVPNVPKDALRQNCISALRKLCNQGSISPKQKRVLLTDIITCSAKGEFSMVEVAYELLCGEGEDKDAAEEEFADQCRVFAQSLPDSPSRS